MIEFLVGLVSPIFESMGASATDVLSYAYTVSGYIYAIVALLVVMIVVIIAATIKCKKGFKHVVNFTAVLAWVLIVVIIANMICYGPLYSTVSGVLNASKIELSEETVANSEAVIQETAEEGFVLLKNDGILPLSEDVTNLNVFGWDSTNPLFGGTGSGSSDSSVAVGILAGLQNAGYTTNEDLTTMYTDYRADRPTIAMAAQDWTLPEPTVDYYTDDLMTSCEEFSDTAVIVIGRSGGEGADLPTDMYGVIHGTWNIASEHGNDNYGYTNGTYTNNGDYDDFDEGETYLELSNTEEDMIAKVCDSFDKVIVVINANNTMELGWVDEYDSIGAVILAPGAGKTGFNALGEILNGSINPSGRTVDTFVKDLTATPTFNNAGNFSYTNTDDLIAEIEANDDAYEGNLAFVNYVEGIYVGYKYYETASDDGVINYEDYVQYPFGYGLSYTSFSQEITSCVDNGDSVTVTVNVTNTGDTAGKDVVELYYTPPYTNGGIEKASVNLADFQKTQMLDPGASEEVTFEVAKEDMASYDSTGIKVAGDGGYILEAGEYTMSVRSDSHTVLDSATFTVDADIDYSTDGRESDLTTANNQFEDYSTGDFEILSRADGFANYDEVTAAPANYELSDEDLAELELYTNTDRADITVFEDDSAVMPTTGADNGKTLADYTGVAYDDASWDELLDQLSIEDMSTMINMGGWSTAEIASVGKTATNDCDGPAGLNNFMTGAQGSAFPSEVLMAQTWSKEMAAKIGDAMGLEYEDANNYGWYGPAMNTHRSAFAGRNFEYYSEDGTLAGLFASAQVNAAAERGVYAYIKHFALNDQETNRCSYLLTWSDEQAIREIYLKPFETVVKNFTGTSLAVMSSFNFIGTVPSCANNTLLNNVLRDEWGFVGMVETDYNGSYGYMNSERAVLNGNDLMLGFGMAQSNVFSHSDNASVVCAMRQACKNILYVVANSGYYTNADDSSSGMTPMTKLFVTVDVIAAVVCIGLEAIVIGMYLKKKKKNK